MSDRIRCACRRCTIRGLMGPAILIALGVLFLLSQWRGDYFSFHYTWPVILLVIGVLKLAESLASDEGHLSGNVPAPPSPGAQGQ
jgi:ABC-type Fe3+ transport system permease subunit